MGHAQEIARRYRPKDIPRYVAAAKTLRQPYWDWASNPSLPAAVMTETLTINGPQGQIVVRNPLYSYRFHKRETTGGFDGPLLNYSQTVRCPLPGGTDNDVVMANEKLNDLSLNLAPDTVSKPLSRPTSVSNLIQAVRCIHKISALRVDGHRFYVRP